MPGPIDHAHVVTISSIAGSRSPELVTRKIRVAGRLVRIFLFICSSSDTTTRRVQAYDSLNGLIVLRDGETTDDVLVDISLCLSPFKTYPWLQEQNTVVMILGYLEAYDAGKEVRCRA